MIAVTAVDRRNQVLIEAGKSLHVDFAAPGADMAAGDTRGGWQSVRGTSYATPLVAGLAWRVHTVTSSSIIQSLASSAQKLSKKAYDPATGYGLLCGDCRSTPKK